LSPYNLWSARGPIKAPERCAADVRALLLAAHIYPEVHLYPRSDGPGSSQDLPQFAAMGHRLPGSAPDFSDPAWTWSQGCLRTPGACIDGEPIVFRALPAENPDATEYFAPDFHTEPLVACQPIPGRREYFVNNILQQFGLFGVRIESLPMPALYRGTGLGGSNLAHLAALVLGSALSGLDLSRGQLYITATQLENYFGVNDQEPGNLPYGVSLTGGQEALAALQGGFWDNVHLPWFNGPFSVISRPLLTEEHYAEAARHLLLVNVGRRRGRGVTSSKINNVWMSRWADTAGAALHGAKPLLAYTAAETLRQRDWGGYCAAIAEYRQLRRLLCADYVSGQEELAALCREAGAEYFPLGAGTGTCLVASEQPAVIAEFSQHFAQSADPQSARTAIPFKIRSQGVRYLGFVENGLALPSKRAEL